MLLHDVGNDPTEIDALLGNPPAFFADLARSLYSLLRLCGPGAGPAAASDDLASPEEAAALRAAFAHTCGNGRDAFLGPRLSSAARAVLQGAYGEVSGALEEGLPWIVAMLLDHSDADTLVSLATAGMSPALAGRVDAALAWLTELGAPPPRRRAGQRIGHHVAQHAPPRRLGDREQHVHVSVDLVQAVIVRAPCGHALAGRRLGRRRRGVLTDLACTRHRRCCVVSHP